MIIALVFLFENLLDLMPVVDEVAPHVRPLLHETLYRRLLIFSLWAMRHRQLAPDLEAKLRPYAKRLRSLSYPEGGVSERLRRGFFLSCPRLFLALKRYILPASH